MLRLAEEDERVVAGAIMGSLAVENGERFSDVYSPSASPTICRWPVWLDDWTRTLIDELDSVKLADLQRGPATYRVFLLPDALHLDISMTGGSVPSRRATRVDPRRFEPLTYWLPARTAKTMLTCINAGRR